MSVKWRDRLGSLLLLAFVGILWMQRDYVTPFGGLFPDRVMICMTVLLVLALVLSFTPYAAMQETSAKPATAAVRGVKHWRAMIVVAVIMVLWTMLLRYVGFAVTGIVGFAGISWYLDGCALNLRSIGTSIGAAVGVTYLIIYIFGHLLLVPLPTGVLF